uniref:Sulfatase-modifying factor enzyme 1 n=1 Tax=Megaviridae environmental sample TaxID=1737588 RepID=A0A5J6VM51_9VIRU|nr:MAG: sulfatase-modifying factor enzyme 1 [Megaviridae environmental sample]
MNLELSLIDIYRKIPKIQNIPRKEELLDSLHKTFLVTNDLTNKIKDGFITGLEKNAFINPLLWEYGHILFFWEHMTFKNLGINNIHTDENVYDSFINEKINRYNKNELFDIDKLTILFNLVYYKVREYLMKHKLNNINYYLIRLSQLHQEMHNESFIFSYQNLNVNINFFENIQLTNNLNFKELEFIKIYNDAYFQGNNNFDFSFDNEKPAFYKVVPNFSVSKYCITNFNYLKFIRNGGYDNKDYWLNTGWEWKKKNNINLPMYWKKDKEIFYEKVFDKYIPVRLDNPVIHISWYEAMAFCKWGNFRLPYEYEWEYLATQFKYKRNLYRAHINYGENYRIQSTIPVSKDENISDLNVVGLFGNCWEWCLEPLHPYDNFTIDPVYREMSYPWFGSRRICRGGSWAVPDILINKSYRNAQDPTCRHQYIGFRVVK